MKWVWPSEFITDITNPEFRGNKVKNGGMSQPSLQLISLTNNEEHLTKLVNETLKNSTKHVLSDKCSEVDQI